jgi:hypothetical protein
VQGENSDRITLFAFSPWFHVMRDPVSSMPYPGSQGFHPLRVKAPVRLIGENSYRDKVLLRMFERLAVGR